MRRKINNSHPVTLTVSETIVIRKQVNVSVQFLEEVLVPPTEDIVSVLEEIEDALLHGHYDYADELASKLGGSYE